MKKTVLSLSLLLSVSALANTATMTCEVQEISGQQRNSQIINVNIDSSDSHGSIAMFSPQLYPKYNGMVAFLKNYAVISISDSETGFASSSQAKLIAADDVAHHQLLLPNNDDQVHGIVVDCQLAQ